MKVLLNIEGKSHLLEVSENSKISEVKEKISELEGVPFDMQKMFYLNKELVNELAMKDFCSSDFCFLDVNFGICGGVGAVEIPDHLRELATKFRCNKMICRKCYARNPPNAKTCRKRKCGHCANIRPMKKLKEKEGKK